MKNRNRNAISPNKSKAVVVITETDGNIYFRFLSEAAKATGCNKQTLIDALDKGTPFISTYGRKTFIDYAE